MKSLISFKKPNKNLTNLLDPFQKDCIYAIRTTVRKTNLFGEKKGCITGSVEFKNKDTIGEQKFEADSFMELCEKIDAFINNL